MRARTALVAAIVVVSAAIIAAAVVVSLMILGPSRTPARATMSLDDHARSACQLLDSATKIRQRGGQMAELNAGLDEFNATTEASQSSTAGIAQIARQEDAQSSNHQQITVRLRTWCGQHWDGVAPPITPVT